MADIAFTIRCLALVLCAEGWRFLALALLAPAGWAFAAVEYVDRALERWFDRFTLESSDG